MAQIQKPRAFKVKLTEYERGWGQRDFGEKYFDNEAEARAWTRDYNLRENNKDYVPEWYVRADYVGAV